MCASLLNPITWYFMITTATHLYATRTWTSRTTHARPHTHTQVLCVWTGRYSFLSQCRK